MYEFLLASLICAGALATPNEWRIVGGQNADEGQFPYQISLRTNDNHGCGGSIINPTTILTAAHCVTGKDPSTMTAVVGTNDIREGGERYEVNVYTTHEEYDSSLIINDIALVHILGTSIEYNNQVQPISLNTDFTGAGVDCVLSGWGKLSFPGFIASKLQYINLRTISNGYCRERLTSTQKPILESQLCTFTMNGEGACKGDSGGPLVSNENQVGVVSWGIACARGSPDVFVRVSFYFDWIKENIIYTRK